MRREDAVAEFRRTQDWDVVIVGGGATGLGCAVDAASRGYRVALVERFDFAKGTSSRSTKLVHGGVRYLEQGNVGLVVEALRERGRLAANAPHLVRDVPFVLPSYGWWQTPYYGLGLKVYDALAGRYGFGGSRMLSRSQTLDLVENLEPEGLRGGVVYRDGQFDDARLAIHLTMTAVDHGATVCNYVSVTGLTKDGGGRVDGVTAVDEETQEQISLRAKVVINATGAWVDGLRRMDEPSTSSIVRPSQGVHVVLDKSFLPKQAAVLVPKTDDGRVLFAIPWNDCVVVGTTDTGIDDVPVEPRALPDELDFILEHARQYLVKDPTLEDVKSVFAGVRPLVASRGGSTKSLSRTHTILVSDSGLVTVTGGKWTTYRQMAEDTIDAAIEAGGLSPTPCRTAELPLHGHISHADTLGRLRAYGSDARRVLALAREGGRNRRVHPDLPITVAQVVFAARHEMARTTEDVLSRRTRALLFDARAAAEAAATVASVLGNELGRPPAWIERDAQAFRSLAAAHVPSLPLAA